MRDYIIFTDSSADLGPELIEELDVVVQPLTFNLNGTLYQNWPDGREFGFDDFYDALRDGGSASTSQVNIAQFTESFRPYLEQGKDILYLGFSSGLSGTVNSGRLAAEELCHEFPDSNIVVVDTLAASLGQGLLVWHAVQQKKKGKNLLELTEWIENNKLNLAHWFTVDDLNFLKRGGRLSGAAAMFGTMLNIKPVIHVDNNGKLIPMEKIRGRKQSLLALVDHMEKTAIKPDEQYIFISHGGCRDEADFLAEEIQSRFGITNIYINYVGPVIGSHSGPGTMALFFLATER